MRTSDFDYFLPPELIAQTPVEPRDHSRLMVFHRRDGSIEHRHFYDLPDYLREGDVLVFNESRVLPARLHGRRAGSGGRVEILLLRRLEPGVWEALARPARRLKEGAEIELDGGRLKARIIGEGEAGIRKVHFSGESHLEVAGSIALPPYIHRPLADPARYQTVFARIDGSVAAPTAGLHFTSELLQKVESMGVRSVFITLHIGLDTFRPVTEDDPRQHRIYREYGELGEEAAKTLSRARREGSRIICVGTTTVRLLEAIALSRGEKEIGPFRGWVDLFILPGHRFRMTDGLVTNFHLPRSTLLMLVSAFAGRDLVLKAYQEAVARQYRFFSFGDAMLIL